MDKETLSKKEVNKELDPYELAFSILYCRGQSQRQAFFGPSGDSWRYQRVVEVATPTGNLKIYINNPGKSLKTLGSRSIFLQITREISPPDRELSYYEKCLIELGYNGGCFVLNGKKKRTKLDGGTKAIITNDLKKIKNSFLGLKGDNSLGINHEETEISDFSGEKTQESNQEIRQKALTLLKTFGEKEKSEVERGCHQLITKSVKVDDKKNGGSVKIELFSGLIGESGVKIPEDIDIFFKMSYVSKKGILDGVVDLSEIDTGEYEFKRGKGSNIKSGIKISLLDILNEAEKKFIRKEFVKEVRTEEEVCLIES